MTRILLIPVVAIGAVRAVVQPDPVAIRPQHYGVAGPHTGQLHALPPAEADPVAHLDPGHTDDLKVPCVPVAGGPLATQVLFEASSRRSVVGPAVERPPARPLRRRLITRNASMAWHPLQIHPVVPSDPRQAGPDLVRESLCLLRLAVAQTSQHGLGIRAM